MDRWSNEGRNDMGRELQDAALPEEMDGARQVLLGKFDKTMWYV